MLCHYQQTEKLSALKTRHTYSTVCQQQHQAGSNETMNKIHDYTMVANYRSILLHPYLPTMVSYHLSHCGALLLSTESHSSVAKMAEMALPQLLTWLINFNWSSQLKVENQQP